MSYFSESSEKTLRFGDLGALENAPLSLCIFQAQIPEASGLFYKFQADTRGAA